MPRDGIPPFSLPKSMKRALSVLFIGIFLLSLPSEAKVRLQELYPVVDQYPDSVLSILDNIDRNELKSARKKADYFLLRVMARDGVYGNLKMENEASFRGAAEYFQKKGPDSKRTLAWYYMGRIQLAGGNVNGAIISFTRAEKYVQDQYLRGVIYREMSRTYAASLNTLEEIRYMKKASEAFALCSRVQESGECLLQTGIAYFNIGDLISSEDIFKSVLYTSHHNKDSLLEVNTLRSYSSLCLSKDPQDPSLAISMLARVQDQLGYPLGSEDKGNLSYAYSILGRMDLSDKWLKEAKRSAETPQEYNNVRFREYQIASRKGDTKTALSALEDVMDYNSSQENAGIIQNAIASQRDFFASENEASQQKLRSTWMRFLIVLLFIALGIVILLNYYRIQKMDAQRKLTQKNAEAESLMNLAEDLQARIQEMNSSSPDLSDNFTVLERLCEQFYVYEGTENLQPKVLREVKTLIDTLRSDSSQIEDILNKNCHGLMTRFRAAFPSMKEDDIRLYCYSAAGLSTSTISTLMEKDKQYIYTRLHRLKGKISSSGVDGKEDLLSALSK